MLGVNDLPDEQPLDSFDLARKGEVQNGGGQVVARELWGGLRLGLGPGSQLVTGLLFSNLSRDFVRREKKGGAESSGNFIQNVPGSPSATRRS